MKTFEISQKSEGLPLQAQKPLIGLAVACAHTQRDPQTFEGLLQSAQRGVESVGGAAVRFSFENIGEEMAWGHGMQYLLPRRDLLADELECIGRGAGVDGLLLVGDSSESVAGLLMGAVRGRFPALLLTPGQKHRDVYADGKSHKKNGLRTARWGEALAAIIKKREKFKNSKKTNSKIMDSQEMGDTLEAGLWPEEARWAMSVAAEALGASLLGTATLPADSPQRFELAYQAGARIVAMAQQNLPLSKILGNNAFTNAIRLDAALGGHPEVFLHLLAIAHECGVRLSVDVFDRINRETAHMTELSGSELSGHTLADLDKAGGVKALLWTLKNELLASPTVSGKNILDVGRESSVRDPKVIRAKNPYRKSAGLAVLFGNLAPAGAVTNTSSWPSGRLVMTGAVKVFDSEEACCAAIKGQRVKKGDILAIRYEGPAGGPGMRPLCLVPAYLEAFGLVDSVPVITDGRFVGRPKGLLVGMVSPEAVTGAPLSLLREGDQVEINIPSRQLLVRLTDTELKGRMARWKAPTPKPMGGYLARYAKLVSGAHQGAVVK